MTILQVNTQDARGGAEQIARMLHHAYRARGHRAFLAVGVKHAQADDGVFGIPYHRYPTLWQRVCWKLRRELTPHLAQRHAAAVNDVLKTMETLPQQAAAMRGREFMNFPATAHLLELTPARPDMLHCHNLHGHYFDVRTLPRSCQQMPVMLTLHDAWLLSGHCAHSFDCERWKIGCGHCPNLAIYPAIRRDATRANWRRKQAIFRRCRLYVAAPSQWLLHKAAASLLAPAIVESRVIPNGVNLSIFRPAEQAVVRAQLGLPADTTILLFAAHRLRANQFKDYATIQQAMFALQSTSLASRLLLLVMGEDGAEERFGEIALRWIPYQDAPAAVARYYQAADLYLHAAHADTFPNSVIESLACGTPVVATAVGGIPEQIDDQQTGMLVPPGDADAMAAAIAALLAQPSRLQAMRRQASSSAARRFDAERMADAYLTWYQDILASWHR